MYNHLTRATFTASLLAAVLLSPVLALAQAADTGASSSASSSAAINKTAIQLQIDAHTAQLNELNKQIDATNKTLKETQSQKASLQRDLKVIDGTVTSLNLGIQADQVSVAGLQLQIQSLSSDMGDIASSIASKQKAVEEVLRQVQKKESQSPLATILGSQSLADGLMEDQTLREIQGQLSSDMKLLSLLHDSYQTKVQQSTEKKTEVSFHQKDLQNKKLIVQDQQQERQQLLVATKDKESVYQKQMNALLEKQASIAAEMEALDRALRLKIDPNTLPTPRRGVLGYPIEGGVDLITQGYGATSFAKYGYRGKWHNGVDFGVPVGTPVLSAEDGVVVAVGNQDAYCYRGAYGKFIVINHDNNLTTLYGHLSRQVVVKGDTVKRGDVIGYSGKTGYATGPHLHLTVYAQPTFSMGSSNSCGAMPQGGDMNPLIYL